MNLKLRAWDKNHKMMDYIEDLYWFEENGIHNFDGNGLHMDYDIMLCSGLHDSKRSDEFQYGQEVYENDILKDLEGNIYIKSFSLMVCFLQILKQKILEENT